MSYIQLASYLENPLGGVGVFDMIDIGCLILHIYFKWTGKFKSSQLFEGFLQQSICIFQIPKRLYTFFTFRIKFEGKIILTLAARRVLELA